MNDDFRFNGKFNRQTCTDIYIPSCFALTKFQF